MCITLPCSYRLHERGSRRVCDASSLQSSDGVPGWPAEPCPPRRRSPAATPHQPRTVMRTDRVSLRGEAGTQPTCHPSPNPGRRAYPVHQSAVRGERLHQQGEAGHGEGAPACSQRHHGRHGVSQPRRAGTGPPLLWQLWPLSTPSTLAIVGSVRPMCQRASSPKEQKAADRFIRLEHQSVTTVGR